MALIGYERVSKSIQRTENQRERLTAAGVDPDLIFSDHGASGAKASRPGWDQCLAALRKGDTLVCVRLDRIGRSVRNLVDVVNTLSERGVNLRVLDQSIDTSTPAGRLVFHVFAAIAEFERELIIERTRDGLATTAARGRNGGRKPRLSAQQVTMLRDAHDKRGEDGKRVNSIEDLRTVFGGKPLGRTTVYRALGMLD